MTRRVTTPSQFDLFGPLLLYAVIVWVILLIAMELPNTVMVAYNLEPEVSLMTVWGIQYGLCGIDIPVILVIGVLLTLICSGMGIVMGIKTEVKI